MERYYLHDKLTTDLFCNPTSEYRGTPFWAWNGKLNIEEMIFQIDSMHQMGFGGFHIHSRTGMDTPYLSDEFMSYVKCCVNYAKEKEMLAWLYDEDRCSSGFAGGLVTKNEEYRARYLVFTPRTKAESESLKDTYLSDHHASRTNKGRYIASYDIILGEDNLLRSYRRIGEMEEAKGVKWYAYLETPSENPWYKLKMKVMMKKCFCKNVKISKNKIKGLEIHL